MRVRSFSQAKRVDKGCEASPMRTNPYYELEDPDEIRRLIDENPWATLVSNADEGLVASHYPILIDRDREALSIVTHLGRPDNRVHDLPNHELLVIAQGPHGYISSSWYGEHVEVPTWNFTTAHLSGTPEILSEEENSAVLHRLVEHFERRVGKPRLLDGTLEDAENAERDMRGTVGLRLTPTRIVAKRKMSQNHPSEIREAVIEQLEGKGPYSNAALAREMRLASG
jgi:transcriptional regulator